MHTLKHRQTQTASAADVKISLSLRMESLCASLIADKPMQCGNELRYGSRGSLSVVYRGDRAGKWHDHESDEGGGPIDLIMRERSHDFKEALAWAIAWLGGAISAPSKPRTEPKPLLRANPHKEQALSIWGDCEPLAGSPAEAYLNSRAIMLGSRFESAIRYAPSLYGKAYLKGGDERRVYTPALVALVRDIVTGEPIAIERRYLTHDGQKHPLFDKAKALGATAGGAIMLRGPDEQNRLNVCEGLEDALSLACITLEGGIWALSGTSGLRRFAPVPSVETIRIFADHDADGAGELAAQACAELWQSEGKAAVYQTFAPHKDVNAYLQFKQGART